MGVNSLPKRRGCDLNPGPSAPESSTLTIRLSSHPFYARCPYYFITLTMNLNFTTFAQISLAWTAGYCYRRCDVAWYVCWAHPVSSAKTDKQIEMPFEQKNHVFDGGAHRRHLVDTTEYSAELLRYRLSLPLLLQLFNLIACSQHIN